MFCGKCGAKNESGAAFCYACGAPLGTAAPAGESAAAAKPGAGTVSAAVQDSGRHKKIGIAAVAAAAVVVIFVVFSLFGGRGDKATAEQFFDAVFYGDAAAIVDLVPKGLVNTMIEESGYSREEVAEEFGQMADYLNSSVDALKAMGSGVDISYDAVDSEDVDASQLSYLQEQYDEVDVDVSAARTVSVEFRVQVKSLGIDETNSFDVPVVKVGRSWYIDVMDLNF